MKGEYEGEQGEYEGEQGEYEGDREGEVVLKAARPG